MEQIARTAAQLGAALRRRRRELALTQTKVSEQTHLRQGTF